MHVHPLPATALHKLGCTAFQGPSFAIHQDDVTLDGMDEWNKVRFSYFQQCVGSTCRPLLLTGKTVALLAL